MIKQNQTYLNRLHVLIDAICIYLAGVTAYQIRFNLSIFGFEVYKYVFTYNRYPFPLKYYQLPLIIAMIVLDIICIFWALYAKTISEREQRTDQSFKIQCDRTGHRGICHYDLSDPEFPAFSVSAVFHYQFYLRRNFQIHYS